MVAYCFACGHWGNVSKVTYWCPACMLAWVPGKKTRENL